VLTSPFAVFNTTTNIRLNVSFPFTELNQNDATLSIYNTNSLGHVERLLATFQPPSSRSYDMQTSATSDGSYAFDVCLPSAVYRLMLVGSRSDSANVNGTTNALPLIVINSIHTSTSSACYSRDAAITAGNLSLSAVHVRRRCRHSKPSLTVYYLSDLAHITAVETRNGKRR
jgi:hypothetical protein